MLVNPPGCLEPEISEVGIDVLDADAEQNICGKRAFADNRVVDMCSRASEIVKVWEGVKDVETGTLEYLQVVPLEIVRQRRKLILAGVVMILRLVVQEREAGMFFDKRGSLLVYRFSLYNDMNTQ